MTSRRTALVLALVAAAAVTACSAADPDAGLPPAAQASRSAPAATTSAAPVDTSCHATASLRPAGALPATPKGGFLGTPTLPVADGVLTRIKTRGRLTAGVAADTLLFGQRNRATGTLEGFDIDRVRAVAAALLGSPDKVDLVVIPYADRVDDVAKGVVDIVADTMTINCARRQSVDFSEVYYDAGQRLLVPRTSGVTSLDTLTPGDTVCAAAGSTSLMNIQRMVPDVQALAAGTQADCLVAVQQGRATAISTDDTILLGLAFQDPTLTVVGPRFTDEPYGMAVSQSSPAFERFVNAVLERERTTGSYTASEKAWFSQVPTFPIPAQPAPTYRD